MREMKDSGVDWIGEIPKDWEIGKTLFALRMPITDGPHETPELFDEGIPFVSAEAVSCGNGHIDFAHIRGFISQEFYEECCKKYIPEINDIYMIKSGATTGRVAKVETNEIFTIWSPLAVFRCNSERSYYNYIYYFIQSEAYQKQIENKWTYGTQQNIGMRTLEKLIVCFPPIEEQIKIADYLDIKCTKIDSIIKKQQTIIKKLEEYKLSIITEATTHGIETDVEMVNCEDAWVDAIPSHWKRMRLKHLCSFHNGDRSKNYPSPEEFVDLGIPFIGADSLNGLFVDISNAKCISQEKYNSMGGLKIETGDILYTLRGSTIGKNSMASFSGGTVASSLMGIRVKRELCDERYILYFMNSMHEYIQRDVCINGSTAPNLSAEDVKQFVIYIPDRKEQSRIVDFLSRKCDAINQEITSREELIEKMFNYKKSIIYEVVTGKKEV